MGPPTGTPGRATPTRGVVWQYTLWSRGKALSMLAGQSYCLACASLCLTCYQCPTDMLCRDGKLGDHLWKAAAVRVRSMHFLWKCGLCGCLFTK